MIRDFWRRCVPSKQSPSDPTLRDLDAEMTSILDRPDIGVSEKVRLYNQMLLRYNDMTKTHANEPTGVVLVNDEKVGNDDNNDEENDTLSEIVATMPKSLQLKAGMLTARLKKIVDWNDRSELLHEGVAIPGSNITDLVHDLVRRRKTFEPVGWQQLAGQLRGSNMPMELVGNIARRQHIQKGEITLRKKQATTPRKKQTVSRRKTPALVLDDWESC